MIRHIEQLVIYQKSSLQVEKHIVSREEKINHIRCCRQKVNLIVLMEFEYVTNDLGQVTHQRFIKGGIYTEFSNQVLPKGGYK